MIQGNYFKAENTDPNKCDVTSNTQTNHITNDDFQFNDDSQFDNNSVEDDFDDISVKTDSFPHDDGKNTTPRYSPLLVESLITNNRFLVRPG